MSWCLDLSLELKVNLFPVIVELVLVYGYEVLTMTAKLTKAIDVVYTKMLRVMP